MSDEPAETTVAKFRWPLAVVCIVVIASVLIVVLLKECKKTTTEGIHALGTQLTNVLVAAGDALEKFTQGTITHTFEESLPTMARDPGGRLELTSYTATETFSKTDSKTTAWGWVNLGSTVSEIKVPATYRYYVRLHDPWHLEILGTNICVVHAPRIRPTLPPAIDTSRMEKKSAAGWGRFNGDEQMTELEQSITPTLVHYAIDSRHMDAVREDCRKTVAEFVRQWLLREKQWQDDRFTSIKVVFDGETATNLLTLPPTLEFRAR